MKKRVLITVTFLTVLGTLFIFPVSADTYISVANSKVTTKVVDNVEVIFRAVQLKGPSEQMDMYNTSSGMNYIGNHISVVVEFKISNYNNYPVTVRSLAPRFVFANGTDETYRRITNITNYSNEIYLSIANTSSYFTIVPSYNFSNGSLVCVPTNSSIVALAVIDMFCEIPVNSQIENLNFGYASISSVELYNDSFIVERSSIIPQGSNEEIVQTLEEILSALQSTSSSSVSSDSSTLSNQSSSVHSQEATYYAQNSQAIQATGLSNYQFDSSTSSGISGVRGDFNDVWNSLGGWTSVYIFSLTLGLALTILRHSPSAISSAIRRKRYNNNE